MEHDDRRSLTDVVRGAVESSRNKADWKAQKEHGSGASLARHWDTLPRGVRADVRELAQWRDFGAPLARYDALCRTNGTNLLTAVHGFNQLENLFISDPVEAIMFVCQRKGLDPGIMARCFWQRVYDPQTWAAGRVNNLSYQTGASHMAGAACTADANSFLEANPSAQPFIDEQVSRRHGATGKS
jgi:hypothetical protein